ncbi:hypothetical protein [Streptomyces sp. NPDC091371]|uniref:hypothetical protein n=1 Tax=Streptomyces sp. NPDC091371 TaxID=3155303 RepID=UPI003448ECD5
MSDPYVMCAGWALKDVTAADLVGSYTGDPRGSLTLAADGTLSVTDWTDDMHRPGAGDTFPILATTGKGTWSLEPNPSDELMEVDVALDTQHGGRHGVSLGITGTRQGPKLHHVLGDPDNCDVVTLTKRA